MKQKLSLVFAAIAVAAGVVGISACKKTHLGDSAEFKDITVSALLGESFKLGQYILVEYEGENYKAQYTVIDADGNEVEVFSNRFNVEKISGYKIELIYDVEGQSVERTVTVKVEDREKPTIRLGDFGNGVLHEEYNLPNVAVYDNSGENITPQINVYYEGENGDVSVLTANNRFVPENAGDYRLEVSAADTSGNVAEKTAYFVVEETGDANVLESFTGKRSVNVVTNFSKGFALKEPVHHIEFEGRQGVVETDIGKNTGNQVMCVNLNVSANELASKEWDYLSVWVYLEKEGTYNYLIGNKYVGTLIGNRWQEIKLTKTDLTTSVTDTVPGSWYWSLENFAESVTTENGRNFLFSIPNIGDAKIYIDSISCALFDNTIEDFADADSLSILTNKQKGFSDEDPVYFAEFQGKSGVVSVKTEVNAGNPVFCFRFDLAQSIFTERNWTAIAITLYIDAEGVFDYMIGNQRIASVEGKTWQTIVLSKTDLTTGAGSSPGSWYWSLDNFSYNVTASEGQNYLFSLPNIGSNAVYFDMIKFV